MPIIINEFEIIADPLAGKQGDAGGAATRDGSEPGSGEVTALRPDDIVRTNRIHRERFRRVRAD